MRLRRGRNDSTRHAGRQAVPARYPQFLSGRLFQGVLAQPLEFVPNTSRLLELEVARVVVGELAVSAPFGLLDCALHGARDPVCIENRRAVEVARGAADGLDQRTLRTQKAFLVRVEDRDQRHFWNVQALAQ